MLSWRLVVTSACLVTFLSTTAPSSSLAQTVPSDSMQVVTAGTGSVTLRPDRAIVQARLAATRPRASEATAGLSALVRTLMDSLASASVPRDSVRTISLQVAPMYDRDGRPLRTYVASAMVEVTVRDFTQLGRVADACLSAGVSSLDQIRFQSDSVQSGKARALAAAYADARDQAEALALASGTRLDRLIALSTVPGQVWAEPQAVSQVLSLQPGIAGVISPEDVRVQATVYVRWGLRRADTR